MDALFAIFWTMVQFWNFISLTRVPFDMKYYEMAARYLSTRVSFNLVIDLRGENDPPSKMLGLAFLVWLLFFGVRLTVMN